MNLSKDEAIEGFNSAEEFEKAKNEILVKGGH